MIANVMFKDRGVLEMFCREFAEREGNKARVLVKYWLCVDEHDQSVGRWLISDGVWESWITLAMARVLKPGMMCIDVGCHFGYFTVLMRDGVGEDGGVLAIDANSKAVELLHQSIKVNGWENVEAIHQAVTDQNGKSTKIYVQATQSGGASIFGELNDGVRTETVKTMTLDSIEWARVDLVKIDAEGAEELIWKGMQKLIERQPEIIIVMEVDARRYQYPGHFFEQIAARFPLRYVDYLGNVQDTTIDHLITADLQMLWLQNSK